MSLEAFTGMHIDTFHHDLDVLGIRPANHYPKSSEHIDDMVDLADRLVKKGYAYEKLRSIYFDISRFKEYGRLSGIDLDKIRLGATVDLDEYEKDNPRDFTLLKRTRLSELKRGIYIKTDWGNMRPSWHLQCAAMSMRYLGDYYDIHCAGRELVFPHHENEVAIAGALTGKTLAKYWIHCDRVLVDGKKVDEGDALTIQRCSTKGSPEGRSATGCCRSTIASRCFIPWNGSIGCTRLWTGWTPACVPLKRCAAVNLTGNWTSCATILKTALPLPWTTT